MENNIQMDNGDVGYIVRIGAQWNWLKNETGASLCF
jgi:hypothetical protein